MSIELSIVMPCLNEAETLEICISKARTFLERSGISGEIVIGDNGSTDGSPEIASRCRARVVNVSVRGYGAALYGAIMATQGKYCVVGDSDDSCDFTRLGHFVEKLRAGADLVVGNGGRDPFEETSPIRDFHCGLRAFSKDAFLRMDLRTTGMEFADDR